jgi:hypothetical protein
VIRAMAFVARRRYCRQMNNNERGSFGAFDVVVILVILFGLFGISLLIAAS